MESETFSTLSTISKKFNITLDKSILNEKFINTRSINFNEQILYNEKDIIEKIAMKKKFMYMRFDTHDQLKELKDKQIEEFGADFPDYSIVVGISNRNEINQTLLFLLRLCSRNDINVLAFYDKNTLGRELFRTIEIIANFTGITLEFYKID